MHSGSFWEVFYFSYKMWQMCSVLYFPTSVLNINGASGAISETSSVDEF